MQMHCAMHLHYTEDRLEIFEVNKMIDINPSTVSLRAKSRLTERSQTTIPAAIHDALHLQPGEIIEYSLLADGNVIISRQTNAHEDPIVSQFPRKRYERKSTTHLSCACSIME